MALLLTKHHTAVPTLFHLLGNNEVDVTAALGFTLARAPQFAKKVLAAVGIGEAPTEVRLEQRTELLGRTDVEIQAGTSLVILEAKLGFAEPSVDQIERYARILEGKRAAGQALKTAIITTTGWPDELAERRLKPNVLGSPVRHVSWRLLAALGVQARVTESRAGKGVLDDFEVFLRSVIAMTNVDSNLVYVVSLGEGGPTTGGDDLAERRGRQPDLLAQSRWRSFRLARRTAQLSRLSLAQEAAVDSACRGTSAFPQPSGHPPRCGTRGLGATHLLSLRPTHPAPRGRDLGRYVWQWPLLGRSGSPSSVRHDQGGQRPHQTTPNRRRPSLINNPGGRDELMPLPSHLFATVTERDIDLLVLEELTASAPFRSWWLSRTRFRNPDQHRLVGAWHSYTTQTGQTDVLLVVENAVGKRYAVMIEDKIYAPPQPRQAERYIEQGERGVREGLWERYRSCITAAKAYLDTTPEIDLYGVKISHEAIRSWFEASPRSARARHKAALLTAAIEQSRRGYVKLEVAAVTQFWLDYWRISVEEFPDLKMKKPGPGGERSRWIFFGRPAPGRRLIHKLDDGCVDLELRGKVARLSQLRTDNRAILDWSVRLEPAQGSAVFRIQVPRINHQDEASTQVDEIRTGLQAAYRLLMLSPDIKGDA